MAPEFLQSSYDQALVLSSVLVAVVSSYVALGLARCVRAQAGPAAIAWVGTGGLVMGSGIWAMHFSGMLALELPIATGYAGLETFLSWVAAVAISVVALSIATREHLTKTYLLGGALVMGGGISAMHYLGMRALVLEPGIVWDWSWVALSVAIAVGASAAALTIFFAIRSLGGRRAQQAQLAASVVMGLAISGMHYAGIAAASFPKNSICLSADGLRGGRLGISIIVAVIVLLSIGLLATDLERRLRRQAEALKASLQVANEKLAAANAELRRLAFSDQLTGIANRVLFEDRLDHALARVDRRNTEGTNGSPIKAALLFIDLDGFKPINDTLGHAAGDDVLQEVARRLRSTSRESDTVARIGGDEFVVLLEDVADLAQGEEAADRIVQLLSQPFTLPTRPVSISCSIGLALYPDHGKRDQLVASADAAMYVAKKDGGARYVAFRPHMLQTTTTKPEAA